MDILEILRSRELDLSKKIKFVRHQGDRGLIPLVLEHGLLDEYQCFQSKRYFGKCDYMVAFIGDGSSHARLSGVFQIVGDGPVGVIPKKLVKLGHPSELPDDNRRYDLREVPGFDDLKERLVVDWGKGALAWHQWARAKEVVQILPAGYVRPFPGYLDFQLSFDDLREMVEHPRANREWKTVLSHVAGVYLILDSKTGQQYVGSAYGKDGVWGRWSEYAKTGHAGNVQLRELLAKKPGAARGFRFALLRTLPRTLTPKEVIGYETLYKEKLGTRAFGLNSN